MSDRDDRVNQEIARDLRRIHNQLQAEGKLDQAIAIEGAGILFLPLVLGAAGLVGWALKSLGAGDTATVMLGVPLLIGLFVLAVYLLDRR
jgi:hypothetical protein